MARFSGSTYSAAVDESKRLIALATLGNTQVDMSDYYNKKDSDNKFAAKVDLDTLSTSLDDLKTVHDTHVADSVAHLTQDERDKILTTDDIATIISTNPSNNKVASEKAVSDLLQNEGSGNLTIPLNEDLNNLIYNRTRVWMNSQTDQIETFTNKPSGRYEECAVIFIPYENATDIFGEQIFVGNKGRIYIRNKFHEEWTAWQRVCTTRVADTSGTVTLPDNITGTISYKVINGVCYVSIQGLADGLTGGDVATFTGLPKPDMYVNIGIENAGYRIGTIYTDDAATFHVHKTTTGSGFCSFSYPVAES